MKRAKRSNNRAFKLGFNQGAHGHPKEICPFHSQYNKRAEWMSGWREGHASYVAGYRIPGDTF